MMGNIRDELITQGCPIGFGDCPDCHNYREGECQYEANVFELDWCSRNDPFEDARLEEELERYRELRERKKKEDDMGC